MLPLQAPKKFDQFGNPIEDDINAMPGVGPEQLQADDTGGTGGGGGGAAPASQPPATVVQPASFLPPKPTWEQTVGSSGKIKSAGTQEAENKLLLAEGRTDNAQAGVNGVAVREGAVDQTAANDVVTEKHNAIAAAEDAEAKRRKWVDDSAAADDLAVKEIAEKKLKAGGVREHWFDGRTGAKLASAILSGVATWAQAWRKDQGPNPADEVLNAQIAAKEKALTADYESSKEAHQLRKENEAAFQVELEKRRVWAANRSLASIDLIEAQTKAAMAGLSPERQRAGLELLQATTNEARAQVRANRAASYDRTTEVKETNRSETGPANSGRGPGLSEETTKAATNAAIFERLGKEQTEIIKRNDGGFPFPGTKDDAVFQANERALRRAQQKGESDNDAKLSEQAQGSPGFVGQLASQIPAVSGSPIANPVENYLATLGANTKRLRDTANTRISIENKAAGSAASNVVNGTPPAPGKIPLSQRSDDEVRAAAEAARLAKNAKAHAALLSELDRRRRAKGASGGK